MGLNFDHMKFVSLYRDKIVVYSFKSIKFFVNLSKNQNCQNYYMQIKDGSKSLPCKKLESQ